MREILHVEQHLQNVREYKVVPFRLIPNIDTVSHTKIIQYNSMDVTDREDKQYIVQLNHLIITQVNTSKVAVSNVQTDQKHSRSVFSIVYIRIDHSIVLVMYK